MTSVRLATYIGGGALLVAWFAAAASSPVHDIPPARDRAKPAATSGSSSIASEVEAQASKLRERLAQAPAPDIHPRNPFSFAAPRAVRPANASSKAAAADVSAEPPARRACFAADGNRGRTVTRWAAPHRRHRRRGGRAVYGDSRSDGCRPLSGDGDWCRCRRVEGPDHGRLSAAGASDSPKSQVPSPKSQVPSLPIRRGTRDERLGTTASPPPPLEPLRVSAPRRRLTRACRPRRRRAR